MQKVKLREVTGLAQGWWREVWLHSLHSHRRALCAPSLSLCLSEKVYLVVDSFLSYFNPFLVYLCL